MKVENRKRSLLSKHKTLEAVLHDEETRPRPNEATIKRLKAEKLAIKDQLAMLNPETMARA